MTTPNEPAGFRGDEGASAPRAGYEPHQAAETSRVTETGVNSFPKKDAKYRPDSGRTFRSRAGESVADARNTPGLILLGIGVVAIAATLAAAGYGFAGWAIVGAIVAVVCLVAGGLTLILEHRRVRAHASDGLRDPQGH
ncbi:hypothetical protein ACWDSJ_36025 [Nocardia sp. NPDC003482]|uniref:hypothetical protein n=1 Tax=Nocardia sp. NPDC004068 TaxID=3364303 RepID=UPI00367D2802